jgi:hypothetical protein
MLPRVSAFYRGVKRFLTTSQVSETLAWLIIGVVSKRMLRSRKHTLQPRAPIARATPQRP